MKNATLYLPGFHLATLRRRPRSASQKLADQFAEIRRKSISQLAACFTHFIPDQALKPHRSGPQSRLRLFSKENGMHHWDTRFLPFPSNISSQQKFLAPCVVQEQGAGVRNCVSLHRVNDRDSALLQRRYCAQIPETRFRPGSRLGQQKFLAPCVVQEQAAGVRNSVSLHRVNDRDSAFRQRRYCATQGAKQGAKKRPQLLRTDEARSYFPREPYVVIFS